MKYDCTAGRIHRSRSRWRCRADSCTSEDRSRAGIRWCPRMRRRHSRARSPSGSCIVDLWASCGTRSGRCSSRKLCLYVLNEWIVLICNYIAICLLSIWLLTRDAHLNSLLVMHNYKIIHLTPTHNYLKKKIHTERVQRNKENIIKAHFCNKFFVAL